MRARKSLALSSSLSRFVLAAPGLSLAGRRVHPLSSWAAFALRARSLPDERRAIGARGAEGTAWPSTASTIGPRRTTEMHADIAGPALQRDRLGYTHGETLRPSPENFKGRVGYEIYEFWSGYRGWLGRICVLKNFRGPENETLF